MKIGFYSSRMAFEPDSLTTRGIGGSESALINLTREWKDNNPDDHVVIYNNNSGKKSIYCGVHWKTLTDFQLDVRTFDLDVLISLREPEIFSLPYIDAKLKVLWSEDNMEEKSLQVLKENKYATENIDKIFVISQFAYNDLKKSFPNSNIDIVRNGYNKRWINSTCEKRPIAVYSSTPFRGLDLLEQLWPIIYNMCIDRDVTPVLRIFGGMSLYGQSNGPFSKLYDKLKLHKGVRIYNSVSQSNLYRHMQDASVMLYPNIHTETGCMAVTEALANGLWVVTTDKGALGEQVLNSKNGYIINADPYSSEYKDLFISYAVTALINQPIPDNSGLIFTWSEQSNKMRKYVEKLL